MADNMRWRYGDTNPVVVPVDSATVIEIGDLVFLETDDARPAGQDTNADGTGDLWNTNLATTQEAFHDKFLGIAMQRSRSGDVDPIRVATTGVFEFDAATAAYELGTLVSPDKATGNNLLNQIDCFPRGISPNSFSGNPSDNKHLFLKNSVGRLISKFTCYSFQH